MTNKSTRKTYVRTISEELAVSVSGVQTRIKQYKDHVPTFFSDNKKETANI